MGEVGLTGQEAIQKEFRGRVPAPGEMLDPVLGALKSSEAGGAIWKGFGCRR